MDAKLKELDDLITDAGMALEVERAARTLIREIDGILHPEWCEGGRPLRGWTDTDGISHVISYGPCPHSERGFPHFITP